ncbi:MAG: homoserine kinase [Microcoleus sp. PH2017_15_JOR_U_A]|uniref:homoserine kinase n=1 Tax=unclassified Microcoleus TaxID=2642155 RepID=UPI001DBE7D0F|nr:MULTISPECIES: homoserine kinase [unclassified Microcoleus]MCC3496462.1 homoserine kinase [Microcoleus sp. PH2017_15_JOR_U_A]MCC3596573.1 homoserine kinase [Microcoleus sp. PH2017_26_ELK_O_A]MCC3621460.1 homoserine kinase [Microcoleus sp. PH2017_36_ELK_O_B]
MSATSTVTVTVPATTANLGPGFDCIGAALSLYNSFQFSLLEPPATEKLQITVTGAEAAKVKTDDSNLAYQAFVKLYEYLRQSPPPVAIHIDMQVPLARGLGSSATAIVGGLVGANCLAGKPLSQVDVMQLAIELEGHPDNVVPALLGGCRLAASNTPGGSWEICDIPWHPDIVPVVAIPDFELSTAEARQVLPSEYSRADAIFNAAHLGLLVRALATGDRDWLRCALQDKIHQPYRRSLILGYEAVQEAALNAGACGMVISGAGPTLLALTDVTNADAVEKGMAAAWGEFGVKADVRAISIDTQGAIISA